MHPMIYGEWGRRDYVAALGAVVLGRANVGRSVDSIVAHFRDSYPNATIFPVNRARSAIWFALKASSQNRPGKSEVIYPAYICDSVIEAIVKAGLSPVPVDIEPDLNVSVDCLERAISERTHAVIAVHAYGCPCEIEKIEALCRNKGIFLIDDAANLIGVRASRRRAFGGFGDAGIISFATSKTLVTGCYEAGGLVVWNNPDLAGAAQVQWEELPDPSYKLNNLLAYLKDYQFESIFSLATYYWREILQRAFGKKWAPPYFPPTRMPNISAAIALTQLETCTARIEGRVRVGGLFHRHLAGIPGVRFPQFKPGRYLTRIMVVLPDGTDREDLRAALLRLGVATRRGYALDFSHGGTFPFATAVAPRLSNFRAIHG